MKTKTKENFIEDFEELRRKFKEHDKSASKTFCLDHQGCKIRETVLLPYSTLPKIRTTRWTSARNLHEDA